jgi:hypothetical protein
MASTAPLPPSRPAAPTTKTTSAAGLTLRAPARRTSTSTTATATATFASSGSHHHHNSAAHFPFELATAQDRLSHSALPSSHTLPPPLPYHLQGDPTLYTRAALRARALVSRHPAVVGWINCFWLTFGKTLNPITLSSRDTITFPEYYEVCMQTKERRVALFLCMI